MTTDIMFTLHEITNHRTIKTSYSESPYQIALIATFKPGGNSWVKNSQWQLLSSPTSSPGRLTSRKQMHGHSLKKILHLLPHDKRHQQKQSRAVAFSAKGASVCVTVGLKPVSQFGSVWASFVGRQVKRFGAELKDSAEVIKLYCNLQRQVLSSHHQLQISTGRLVYRI